MKRPLVAGLLATSALLLVSAPGIAQDQSREQQQIQDRDIYGFQLMTPQERAEFRARMRTATSAEERERIRKEHHDQMKERAKERDITLLDEPPPHPGGMGPGGGMGPRGGR